MNYTRVNFFADFLLFSFIDQLRKEENFMSLKIKVTIYTIIGLILLLILIGGISWALD
jgi:hypothetical protein